MGLTHGCSKEELILARTDKLEGFQEKLVAANSLAHQPCQMWFMRPVSVAFSLVFIDESELK